MSKILGLDYGKKRCGISISDELQIIASPLTTIDTKKLMDFLKEIIVEESISAIVIGLPKNNRNNIFELEKTIIDEIKKIKILFPKLSFTSKLSSIYLNQITKKRKVKIDKKNLDKISASIILDSYLKKNK